MALTVIGNSVAAVGGLITNAMNFVTDLFLTPPRKAALKYLEDTPLKTLTGDPQTVRAKSLWDRTGAVIMAVRRPG